MGYLYGTLALGVGVAMANSEEGLAEDIAQNAQGIFTMNLPPNQNLVINPGNLQLPGNTGGYSFNVPLKTEETGGRRRMETEETDLKDMLELVEQMSSKMRDEFTRWFKCVLNEGENPSDWLKPWWKKDEPKKGARSDEDDDDDKHFFWKKKNADKKDWSGQKPSDWLKPWGSDDAKKDWSSDDAKKDWSGEKPSDWLKPWGAKKDWSGEKPSDWLKPWPKKDWSGEKPSDWLKPWGADAEEGTLEEYKRVVKDLMKKGMTKRQAKKQADGGVRRRLPLIDTAGGASTLPAPVGVWADDDESSPTSDGEDLKKWFLDGVYPKERQLKKLREYVENNWAKFLDRLGKDGDAKFPDFSDCAHSTDQYDFDAIIEKGQDWAADMIAEIKGIRGCIKNSEGKCYKWMWQCKKADNFAGCLRKHADESGSGSGSGSGSDSESRRRMQGLGLGGVGVEFAIEPNHAWTILNTETGDIAMRLPGSSAGYTVATVQPFDG